MDFEEFTSMAEDKQLINYIKYLRGLAKSSVMENDLKTLRFDTPGPEFVYLNFLKKLIDKRLSRQIAETRAKLTAENARGLSKLVTDFNNALLINENDDLSRCAYLNENYYKLLEGLKEK